MDLSFDSGKIIYLDNAATTFPKPREVLQQALDAYAHFGVNPGRSGYDLCMVAGELVFETRKVLATFLGAPSPNAWSSQPTRLTPSTWRSRVCSSPATMRSRLRSSTTR